MERYSTLVDRFPWNAKEEIPIIPVVHGTDASVGWHICSAGFAALSSLDAGFYGKGIYYTSSCMYATPYFATKPAPSILVCLIVPGNVRPIIEDYRGDVSFLGVAIDSGYQSHYCLTTKDGLPCKSPKKDKFYDEFVLAQESQAVPIFLATIKMESVVSLAKEFARVTPEDRIHTPRNEKKNREIEPQIISQ